MKYQQNIQGASLIDDGTGTKFDQQFIKLLKKLIFLPLACLLWLANYEARAMEENTTLLWPADNEELVIEQGALEQSAIKPGAFRQNNLQPPRLGGYIRGMPAIRLDGDFGDPTFSNVIHNRLNLRWDLGSNFHFAVEGRNRLLYSQMFRDFPEIADFLAEDAGLLDLSWLWLSDAALVGHSMADRLYGDWRMESWHVRVGRQRINWGITLVSNPNDLFNTYSFFDFDYPERPGADAVRIRHFLGHLSSIELAVSPGRESRETVAAGLVKINRWNYDLQALAGYFRHRAALGLGWAGSIGGAGFKGEATWFYDMEEQPGVARGNLVASTGMDYMFGTGTFGVIEFLYNGGHQRQPDPVFMITQPLRPDNIMFSRYAVTINAQHPFSPILQGGMAVMALPDIEALFLMPSLDYSLARDLDLEFVGQIFLGGEGTLLDQAGSGFFLALQYSF